MTVPGRSSPEITISLPVLDRLPGAKPRRPGPLKVESAEVPGHVHDFADEKQARHFAALHRLRGQLIGADAARGDLGFLKAFRARGGDLPLVRAALQIFKAGVRPLRRRVQVEPTVGQPLGHDGAESALGRREIPRGSVRAQGSRDVLPRRQIDPDPFRLPPVGGDLQDCRAAQSAMSNEHLLAKRLFTARRDHFRGNAGQAAVALQIGGIEDERNQRRTRLPNRQPELARQVVSEGSGADFRQRESAGGHDQGVRPELVLARAKREPACFGDLGNPCAEKDTHAGGATFAFEQVGDLPRRVIAEELSERLFVIGDAVLFYERDEVRGSVPRQGRFAEVRIGGQEIFRTAMQIGEVAAAASGDEDFLADLLGMLQHSNAAPALGGLDGAHESCRARAEHDDIERLAHGDLSIIA